MLLQIMLVILILVHIPFAQATDWSSCADELDRLRRAAADASEAAEHVQEYKEELESKKRELEDCLSYPDSYDVMHDRCQSIRWDYESALSDYKSSLSDLESELNTLESRLRSVQWSCDFQFILAMPPKIPKVQEKKLPRVLEKEPPKVQKKDPCSLYQKYKSSIPKATLLELCKKSMSEDECKKCLDIIDLGR